ncbi:MAG TPA: hypothetical protein DCM73_07955 [Clostridiales bacterium]|nr:hypothetical protein [Clostridiales bacterium]
MERRSILEKLGLVEKIVSEAVVKEQDAEDSEQHPAGTEKIKAVDYVKNADIQVESEEMTAEEQKVFNKHDDPVAAVRNKKLMKINEIYNNYNINTEGINSLSIVESFQKALPDYLPADVKRQSVLNIITSSDVKIGNLVKDGGDKLKCLKAFSQSFSDESNNVISDFENEIQKLNQQISSFKTAIENMRKLQTEQEFILKYEMEKINSILQFISPEN